MALEWRSLLFGPYPDGVFDDGQIRIMSPRPFFVSNSHLRDQDGNMIVPCINAQPGPGRIQIRFYEPVNTVFVRATCKMKGRPYIVGYDESDPDDRPRYSKPGQLLEAPDMCELTLPSWPKGTNKIVQVELFVKNEDGQERLNDGLWGLPEWSVVT